MESGGNAETVTDYRKSSGERPGGLALEICTNDMRCRPPAFPPEFLIYGDSGKRAL